MINCEASEGLQAGRCLNVNSIYLFIWLHLDFRSHFVYVTPQSSIITGQFPNICPTQYSKQVRSAIIINLTGAFPLLLLRDITTHDHLHSIMEFINLIYAPTQTAGTIGIFSTSSLLESPSGMRVKMFRVCIRNSENKTSSDPRFRWLPQRKLHLR
jgi:hypothetical protein